MQPFAWYDPTADLFSKDRHDPRFTPLGQVWPLSRIRAEDTTSREISSLREENEQQKRLLNEFMQMLVNDPKFTEILSIVTKRKVQ